MIFKVTYADRSILITGDARHETVASIFPDNPEKPFGDPDVYFVPHHGSSRPGTPIADVVPKIAICSIDARTATGRHWGHPREKTVRTFEEKMATRCFVHRVLCWKGMEAEWNNQNKGEPEEVELTVPFFTVAGMFFWHQGTLREGIHVEFAPDEENAEHVKVTMKTVVDGTELEWQVE